MQAEMQTFIGKVFPQFEQEQQKSRFHSEYGIGDFLRSHYVSGYERFRDPKAAKQAESADKIEKILETMRNIGSSIKNSEPDGLWGQRTQLALKNIQKLSGAILDFSQAIDFIDQSFTRQDNVELGSQMPDSTNPLKDRNEFKDLPQRAGKIKVILVKLNDFTTKFQKHLTDTYEGQFTESQDDLKKIQRFKEIPTKKSLEVSLSSADRDLIALFSAEIILDVYGKFGNRIKYSFKDNYKTIVDKIEKSGVEDQYIKDNFNQIINQFKNQVKNVMKNKIMNNEIYNLWIEISEKLKIATSKIIELSRFDGVLAGNFNIEFENIKKTSIDNLSLLRRKELKSNLEHLDELINDMNKKILILRIVN